MHFPIQDWQFWVVTGIVLAALVWLLKGAVPIPILSKRHKRRRREKRVNLTIGGKTSPK